MPRPPRKEGRRSYDQFCAAARALDAIGDRWSLLIVRELLAGPRRYTDLHADLPGVSTDVLASRLKDLERESLATRRRLPPPSSAQVYELSPRGRQLLPVLRALGEWGAPALTEPRPTDAVRAHWFALPLLARIEALHTGPGTVQVDLDQGEFHLHLGTDGGPVYGEGQTEAPAARLRLDATTCAALSRAELTFPEAVARGLLEVAGEGELARVLGGG
ncbi:winged helix-turn-helix transcriptional regulator [Streptomyces physcomitrii]|uniref:Helix-turn-helix transcriptional regulator n=1 Tax=Streptomyces physcomitrii TaxID=2724184 RepID=A0ABX1HAS7_9ACTN|nr:helix-turn-helix domain-containing protein [Streptomyces physcomitrii]NKI44086.1 helix-turn-helix transcriptional regulator [Streptomyces physcomitrii]